MYLFYCHILYLIVLDLFFPHPLHSGTSCSKLMTFTGPDSSVVRAFASGAVGHGFSPRPHYTKGDKNGTGSSLVDSRNKRVVPGRYKKAEGYPLFVMSQ